MKIRHLLSSAVILALLATSCGDKKPKEVQVETPKQEVVKPDTIIEETEPVVEEVVEEAPPRERVVVVKEGEWLYDIARAEYGSMHEWKKIYEANKEKIDNPDMIYPNQELIIPE